MLNRILVGYDGSEPARKAFDYGLDLAQKYGARMLVVTVVRPPDFSEDVETEAMVENSRAWHEKLLAPLKQQVEVQAIPVRFEVAVGHPAQQIIFRADRDKTNLIIVGHRGKSLFQRLLLGSVSKQVIQYAECPVLVVR
jgi:nucleotide-binding universal stress UspA family protein